MIFNSTRFRTKTSLHLTCKGGAKRSGGYSIEFQLRNDWYLTSINHVVCLRHRPTSKLDRLRGCSLASKGKRLR